MSAQSIRLQFVIASVLEEENAEGGLRGALQRARLRNEDAEQGQTDSRARGLGVLLRRVTRGDVTDFMPEDARHLFLIVEKRQDPTCDVDVAPRQRKRVHRRFIDHREVPWKVRTLGSASETQPDIGHIAL